MADLIQRGSLGEAWVGAMEFLLEKADKSFHLNVAFPATYEPGSAPWEVIDGFLVAHGMQELQTVVNTIFPEDLYSPELGEEAASRLYESYGMSMRIHQRTGRGNDKETYFNRLISYPVATGGTNGLPRKQRELLSADGRWNQLDFYIQRLRTQRSSGHRRSSYELGASHFEDADLRIQSPFNDKAIGSFPCLSHISLTLVDDRVNLNATYRNQFLIERGFGNYVGLARLTQFIARESGAKAGEVQVVATGADPELDRFKAADLKQLVTDCRAAIGQANQVGASA
ncbi:MAG: hypothetical protein JST59_14765 [Actinobacteria bacterium]|nr:hypothetical protein [Actinomycetota bacterium]